MVGAVGERASMKRRKLLQQCHPNSAGSLVIAKERSKTPHCFCCFFCVVGYPLDWGKRPRYIDRLAVMKIRAQPTYFSRAVY